MKIELVRIGRRVGKRWLMRELSFLFQEGAINVLLGPNGAGKTTLLRDSGQALGGRGSSRRSLPLESHQE